MLLSYGHPERKQVVGARDAKMFKIDIMMWLVVACVFMNVLSDLVRVILGQWFGHDDLVIMKVYATSP